MYVSNELYHHGILGQKWGKLNGPPYPLKANAHSKSEKDANWRNSLAKENSYNKIKNYGDANKKHHENVMRIQNLNKSEYVKKSLLSYENEIYNKKISSIEKSEKNKKIAKKILITSGGIALTAIVGYTIVKNGISDSRTAEWLTNLSNDGAFGNAKLFIDKSSGANYAKNNLWNKQWWDGLNKNEKLSIKSYTGSDYSIMNTLLRKPNDSDFTPGMINYGNILIKHCTDALNKASLPEDAIVHRGVGSLDSLAKTLGVPSSMLTSDQAKKLIGMDFIDPAFGSTGASTRDAWSGVKLHILLPKGSQAMYIDPVSSVPGEHEILINRNARYILKDLRFSSKGTVEDVFVELIEHVL